MPLPKAFQNFAEFEREILRGSTRLGVSLEEMVDDDSFEAEIEVEMAKRREEMRFHLENRKIVFEQEVSQLHREIKTNAMRYLIDAGPLVILVAPVIYSLIIPMVLLDLAVMAYQAICFPIYRIPKVRRRDYLVFDRHHLAYLNIVEKVNCAYCSYCNGAIAFVREVAARSPRPRAALR